MPKNNRDYDDIFKTLKHSHKRLFVSLINDTFKKDYPLNAIPTVLPTDSYIENPNTDKIEERDSDLLLCICGDTYLIECQSYEDGTMAIRIAEYAFLSARNNATWDNGRVILNIPAYVVVYVKSNNNTPMYTEITFNFPNGQSVKYDCKNVLLKDFTKEYIIKNKLFPYIPYYITRYEDAMCNKGNIDNALLDLEYFKTELIKLYQNNELSAEELLDIMNYINRIIKHITNGNEYEERMVSIMGGKIEETPSQEIKRLEDEKNILSLFSNGASFELLRKSFSEKTISTERLLELQKLGTK